jgi:branched-subunit amino acid permease
MKKITLLLLSILTMSTLFAQIRPITQPMRVMQAEQETYNLTAFDWGYYDGYETDGCT